MHYRRSNCIQPYIPLLWHFHKYSSSLYIINLGVELQIDAKNLRICSARYEF